MIDKKLAQAHNLNILDTNNALIQEQKSKIEAIKKILPDVVTADSQLNKDKLEELLGIYNTTNINSGYGLNFVGKPLANAKVYQDTKYELKLEDKQSKNLDTTENMVIRGDNIEVLKILKSNYQSKIKMIYIDPPYNTGNDGFVYQDNFKDNEAELIEKYNLNEDSINYFQNIYSTQNHSSWLSFMYPRLKLARDLLTEDGVIFISIDDNEQANLKIICDEIFGEENFVAQFSWMRTSTPPSLSKLVRKKFEFIQCYSKNKNELTYLNSGIVSGGDMPLLNKGANKKSILKFLKDTVYFNIDGEYLEGTGKDIILGNTIIVSNNYADKDFFLEGEFKWSQQNLDKEVVNGTKFIIKTKNLAIRYIPNGDRIKIPSNLISLDECNVDTNEKATMEIRCLFEDVKLFDTPKPISLLKYLTNLCIIDSDIILDFFAGSGTTGHAVMELNKEDGGNRKYILVQCDEKIKEKHEAYKFCTDNKLQPVVSSITLERLNRAGNKLIAEINDSNKTLDVGYKVFSLTQKPTITYNESTSNMELLDYNRENIDILYNMLVKTGKTLTTKIETITKDIYKVENALYIINLNENDTSIITNFKGSIFINGFSQYINLSDFLTLFATMHTNKPTVIY